MGAEASVIRMEMVASRILLLRGEKVDRIPVIFTPTGYRRVVAGRRDVMALGRGLDKRLIFDAGAAHGRIAAGHAPCHGRADLSGIPIEEEGSVGR